MKRTAILGGCAVLLLAVTAHAQTPAIIYCDPQANQNIQVPVYTDARAAWILKEGVACGQPVTFIGIERGYAKIQFGQLIGYVEGKYTQLLKTSTNAAKIADLEAQLKALQQPLPAPGQKLPEKKKAVPLGSSKQKTSFGGWVGFTFPLQENQRGGLAYGANFDYRILKPLVLEVRAWNMKSYFRTDNKTLSEGTLSTAAGQFSLFYRFNLRNRWALNLGGGGGYYFMWKFDLDHGLVQSWNNLGFTITEKLQSAPGFHVGGNMDVRLTKHIGVNLDARYCQATSKGSWSQKDQISGETTSGTFDHVKLDMIMAGIGFKFLF